MGVGLIEPVDDILEGYDEASYPALLKYLAEQMVALDYDMKQFLRALYQDLAPVNEKLGLPPETIDGMMTSLRERGLDGGPTPPGPPPTLNFPGPPGLFIPRAGRCPPAQPAATKIPHALPELDDRANTISLLPFVHRTLVRYWPATDGLVASSCRPTSLPLTHTLTGPSAP